MSDLFTLPPNAGLYLHPEGAILSATAMELAGRNGGLLARGAGVETLCQHDDLAGFPVV